MDMVGGLKPSEKYGFVNWDDDIPNEHGKITVMFQSTNQFRPNNTVVPRCWSNVYVINMIVCNLLLQRGMKTHLPCGDEQELVTTSNTFSWFISFHIHLLPLCYTISLKYIYLPKWAHSKLSVYDPLWLGNYEKIENHWRIPESAPLATLEIASSSISFCCATKVTGGLTEPDWPRRSVALAQLMKSVLGSWSEP